MTETIIAWDRLYRRGVRTVNLVRSPIHVYMRRFYRFCQLCKHGICNQNISINDNFDNVPSANIGPTLFIDKNLLLGERNSNKL